MIFFHRHTGMFPGLVVLLSVLFLFSSRCLADDMVLSFGDSINPAVTITADKDINFSSFKVNNPYRLVIDIKNLSVAPAEHLDKHKQIPRILVNKTGNGSRIIFEPISGIQLMTRQDSPRTITVLGGQTITETSAAVRPAADTKHTALSAAVPNSPVTVNSLVVKDDTLTLGTSGLVSSVSTFSFPESNRFVFVLADTKLAIKQGRHKMAFLNLTGVDAEQQGTNTKLTFHVKPNTTLPNYFSVKDQHSVSVRFFVTDAGTGETAHQEKKSGEISGKDPVASRFKGQKISLDFDNADIRHVIRLLSDVNKKNYLITDEVKGTISLKLANVPWDQALELILKNHNLAAVDEGNVTEIITFNQNVERIKKKMDLEDFRQSQEQIGICAVQLRHAAATRVSAAANTILTRGAKESLRESTAQAMAQGSGDRTVASDGSRTDVKTGAATEAKADSRSTVFSISNIYAEPNTNRLIIRDLPSKFPEILKVLSLLDVPDQQVMIEARIVEASTDFTRSLGVQWGVHLRDGSASLLGINTINSGFGGLTSTPPTSGTSGPGMDTGFSFGTLASNLNLDMRFSAAASTGLIKIISTPKVAVTYGESATIKDGKKQPYTTVSTNGTQTQFVDAVLSLKVKPIITPSCDVVMDINVTNDSVGAGSPPPINQKSAETKLTVKSGETAVIGGTYVKEESEAAEGVPYLMDIPVFGHLFKSSLTTKRQRELLIFITPRLLNAACKDSDVMQLKHDKLECSAF